MTGLFSKQACLVGGYWAATLTPFLLAAAMFSQEPPEDGLAGTGQKWLALPDTRTGDPAWRSSWRDCFPTGESEVEALPVEGVLAETAAEEDRVHVVVQGRLRKSDGWMCLFFDTHEKRWFHLSEGEFDEKSDLVFESARQPAGLVLLHRKSGRRYVVEAGSGDLSRSDETEPY